MKKVKLGEDEIFLARRIRLIPTPEQETQFWKSVGVARWAYNFFLSENKMVYECTGRTITGAEVRKAINNVLKPNTHKWLKEVSSNVMKQAIKDAENALYNFFNHFSRYPKYKTKHKSKPSFYVNYESLHKTNIGFIGERLGEVRTSEPLPSIPNNSHYYRPRITYDGKFWYLSVVFVSKRKKESLTSDIFGIDLGIKEFAVLSNQDASVNKLYGNINKTAEVRRLKRKLKRVSRKHSRKVLANKSQGRNLRDCSNLEKQRQEMASIYRRLTDIRNNYLHQIAAEIVKAKPSKVVMEDLNVSGMMKNKHLADKIMEQKWKTFRNIMTYKCDMYGIDIEFVPMFYPSSKTCSNCGHIKKDLKLSDRSYVCPECGLVIDRDLNAAINLANYNS